MNTRPIAFLAALALAGCVYVPLGTITKLPTSSLASGGTITVRAVPQIKSGGYCVQSSILEPYTPSDVAHVHIKMFKLAQGSEVSIVDAKGNPLEYDLLPASYSAQVAFSGLIANTTYRIRAYAYKAAGTASVDVISVPASSSLDITFTNDQTPAVQAIPIQLMDRLFNGQVSPGFAISSGSISTDYEDIL